MRNAPYTNRTEAGQLLAQALRRFGGRSDVLVLALPRGGVPVAYEVAKELEAPLDLVLVRKLGVPGQEELAMGAIATGGAQVLNRDVVQILKISEETVRRVVQREEAELARRAQAYRGGRPAPDVAGRCVILVDDGLATGATMRAAVAAMRQLRPSRIVVAVPVAPPDTVAQIRSEADEVVCLATPESFRAVGEWYRDFSQTTDEEVQLLLRRAWEEEARRRGADGEAIPISGGKAGVGAGAQHLLSSLAWGSSITGTSGGGPSG
jgi:putative phosphoribosyl transferase